MIDYDRYPELVIGLVAPVGVDLGHVQQTIIDYLRQFKYQSNPIRISSLIRNLPFIDTPIDDSTEYKRIDSLMTAGDEARKKTRRNDFLATLAVSEVYQKRTKDAPLPGTAHIFNSLKHQDEVQILRSTYGDGFYLFAIASSRHNRKKYLTGRMGLAAEEADKLMQRDEREETDFGQHMRDAFQLADGFIDIDLPNADEQIKRMLHLIFGEPFITPTKDEYAMYLAFASSLRSGDLSRQVGAIITTKSGEVVATGANDVPCSKGGLYSEDDGENDHRDHKRGYDSNERIRNNIAVEIMKKLTDITDREKLLKEGREKLKDTGLFEITEYGRSVHAEMEALVSCARVGIPIRDGTLYTTTFPCHNCTKHLVAAGLSRIVFVEPYPKSKATELHSDSIVIVHEAENEEKNNRVKFEPFVGVGPRKFMDLFSMTLSSGNTKTRKNGEKKVEWSPANSCIRIPLMPLTYIDKETYHYAEIAKLVDQLEGDDDGSKKR